MKNIIIIDMKFRVKIQHFYQDTYIIKYTYYKFIPKWHTLRYWFSCGLLSGLECWTAKLFSIEEAEKFAKTLHGINDIEKYYKPHIKKKNDFYRRKEEYIKKAIPYKQKVIK